MFRDHNHKAVTTVLRSTILVLLISVPAFAQDVPPPTPPTAQNPPYPPGMRLLVGSATWVRNTPNGTCGTPPHTCAAADAVLPGVYGVVQNDPPIWEAAGWWWVKVNFENGMNGWTPGRVPYLTVLNPPQMAQGFSFRLIADYFGSNITSGRCINDGVQSAATLNLQARTDAAGMQGTLSCPWGTPAVGNHIGVVQAINNFGTSGSNEFQFAVTAQVVPTPPAQPDNLRLGNSSVLLERDGRSVPTEDGVLSAPKKGTEIEIKKK